MLGVIQGLYTPRIYQQGGFLCFRNPHDQTRIGWQKSNSVRRVRQSRPEDLDELRLAGSVLDFFVAFRLVVLSFRTNGSELVRLVVGCGDRQLLVFRSLAFLTRLFSILVDVFHGMFLISGLSFVILIGVLSLVVVTGVLGLLILIRILGLVVGVTLFSSTIGVTFRLGIWFTTATLFLLDRLRLIRILPGMSVPPMIRFRLIPSF